jgi:hypothetical protein
MQNPDKVEQEKAEKMAEQHGHMMPATSPNNVEKGMPVKLKKERAPKPKGGAAAGPRKARSTAGKDGFHPDLVLG